MEKEIGFSEEIYEDVLGLKEASSIQFAEDILHKLHQIEPQLFPLPVRHPFAEWITMGREGLTQLISILQTSISRREKLESLDGIAHIFLQRGASEEALEVLKELLKKQETPEEVAVFAKCIALARDKTFLEEQMERLADNDPEIVASAARLLGYGAFAPAIPLLKDLVGPSRMVEAPHIIWALGEIGDPSALDVLERCLQQGFKSLDALVAIGKIGNVISLPHLMPFMVQGLAELREAAFQACALILHKNRDESDIIELLGEELRGFLFEQLEDFSGKDTALARLYMLLSFIRLGGRLEPAQIRRYLGIELSEKEVGHIAGFFIRRGGN